MEANEKRHSRSMQDLLLRLLSLLVLLARLETKRRSFNADLFSTRFFPPLRRSFFCFSVSDHVSKSKFLFPFSFSSHERLPWFKHVWDAPESPLSHGATFKVGDGLTVDRHCFLSCLYFFYIFRENLRFFPVVSILFSFPSLFLMVFLYFALSLFSLLFLSLRYLEICLMVPLPPQFLPPRLFFEICFFVSGEMRWMKEEEW